MISWEHFWIFASVSWLLWLSGSVIAMTKNGSKTLSCSLIASGIGVFLTFIILFWISLHRPPMRTTGETRLWYSFFMMLSALLTYMRWNHKWIPAFSLLVATVFIALNIAKPEIHDESLMPALQSWWFIPHVAVYMFSYSLLGCAFLFACAGLYKSDERYLDSADSLVYLGVAFLSLGMLSGSLWAKQAWGTYWNWDPKETWAAVTWCSYLIYIHMRLRGRWSRKVLCSVLIVGFICLQMCWWGINYLPSARESVHTYSTTQLQ